MPDWNARVTKERAADLGADPLIAAIYFQGLGSAAGQIRFGMATGLGRTIDGLSTAVADQVGARMSGDAIRKAREGYNNVPGSIASKIPDSKGVLAFTAARMIVFGYHQGTFKTRIEDPVLVLDRGDVVGWSYVPGKMASTLNLAFSDDSDLGLDLPRANKPDEFAATLQIPHMD